MMHVTTVKHIRLPPENHDNVPTQPQGCLTVFTPSSASPFSNDQQFGNFSNYNAVLGGFYPLLFPSHSTSNPEVMIAPKELWTRTLTRSTNLAKEAGPVAAVVEDSDGPPKIGQALYKDGTLIDIVICTFTFNLNVAWSLNFSQDILHEGHQVSLYSKYTSIFWFSLSGCHVNVPFSWLSAQRHGWCNDYRYWLFVCHILSNPPSFSPHQHPGSSRNLQCCSAYLHLGKYLITYPTAGSSLLLNRSSANGATWVRAVAGLYPCTHLTVTR